MAEKKPEAKKNPAEQNKKPQTPAGAREPATPGAKPAKPIEGGASYAHKKGKKAGQQPRDTIDEESMQSFPASDAPPHTRSTD